MESQGKPGLCYLSSQVPDEVHMEYIRKDSGKVVRIVGFSHPTPKPTERRENPGPGSPAKAFHETTVQRHTSRGRWTRNESIRAALAPYYQEKREAKQSERDKRKDAKERERQMRALEQGKEYLDPAERAAKLKEQREARANRESYGAWATSLNKKTTEQARKDAQEATEERNRDKAAALAKLYTLSAKVAGVM